MKFIDLNQQYQLIKKDIDAAIFRVLNHGQYIMGPEVSEFEQSMAGYLGVKHAIAMSSGTTALQVALMALDIGPGDEVITTPFSFFATAEVVYLLGAKLVYVDIDPRTYTINPDLLASAITPHTKAIVPVSLYGQCADMDAINTIANQHRIPVIEDAAQSMGAEYKARKSGALSTISCTSFFPSKPLGAYGDAGACFTDDDTLAHKMRVILNHGQEGRYHHELIGINGRCDTIQAAILLQKLNILDDEINQRQIVAGWYDELLAGCVITPYIEPFNRSAFAQYTIQVPDREKLCDLLSVEGIPTTVHYPKGLHEQPVVARLEKEVLSFPIAEYAAKHVLSLPFWPGMERGQVVQVVDAIRKSVVV